VGEGIVEITDRQVADVAYCNCEQCRAGRARNAGPELKAAALLRQFLSPEQLQNYVRHGTFEVVSEGGRRYILGPGNVRAVDGPLAGTSLCITLYDWPPPDLVLARKLLLETDERLFLEIARGGNQNVLAREEIYRDLERKRKPKRWPW